MNGTTTFSEGNSPHKGSILLFSRSPPAAGLAPEDGQGDAARSAAGAHQRAMLDTPTPQSGQGDVPAAKNRRFPVTPSARRLYNRVMLGLLIPGRYYFITWTTTPQGRTVSEYWPALRKYLKRYRPGSTWAYCLTKEGRGRGVIHLVMRIGAEESRPEAIDLRSQWYALTGARQLRIERVKRPDKLAPYMSDQRRGKRLAGELSFQDEILRWRWSRGWLPKGFIREYGRFFWRYAEINKELRDQAVKHWIRECHAEGSLVEAPFLEGGRRFDGGLPPRGTITQRDRNA